MAAVLSSGDTSKQGRRYEVSLDKRLSPFSSCAAKAGQRAPTELASSLAKWGCSVCLPEQMGLLRDGEQVAKGGGALLCQDAVVLMSRGDP